ncbi:MAG: ATP-binding protein [Pseudomonadota bacterium]
MRGLATRIALGLLLTILLAFAVAVGVIRGSVDRQLEGSPPPLAAMMLARLEAEVQATPPTARAAQLERLRVETGGPVTVLLAGDPAIPGAVLAGQPAMPFSGGSFTVFLPLPEGGALVLGPQENPVHPTTADFTIILAVWIGMVVLFGVIIAAPPVRLLGRLEQATQAFGAGDLGARAPVPQRARSLPMAQLAASFNAMADRVQGLIGAQRQLVQAVAHEIRTPIARLRFGLEMLGMAREDADRARRLSALEGDLGEMEALVEELLVFTRYEEGHKHVVPQPVPIRASVERQVERLRPREGIAMVVEPAPGAPEVLTTDARAFNRVLGNLLSNAARHASTRVRVTWATRDGGLELSVEDDGPGIPAADRERVFEPFVRLDVARDRASGGAGLGLAIVKRILDAQGGSVRAEEAPDGGARMVGWWPMLPSSPAVRTPSR